jgi:Cys-tRNA synthase (O-phospho-L-seryl-tRNA:Cys-tRNA synthase)
LLIFANLPIFAKLPIFTKTLILQNANFKVYFVKYADFCKKISTFCKNANLKVFFAKNSDFCKIANFRKIANFCKNTDFCKTAIFTYFLQKMPIFAKNADFHVKRQFL